MKQGNASSTQQAASATRAGTDPVVEQLRKMRLPLNRKNYLSLAIWDDREPTPEEEAQFPEAVRKK